MTKAKRRGWAAAHSDLANRNKAFQRVRLSIPSGTDPAERLAAVQANVTAKRHNEPQPKGTTMADPTREQLVEALAALNDTERAQLLADVGDTVSRETKMQTTATALAGLVSHHQPKKGPDHA